MTPLCLWHVNERKLFHSYYFVYLNDCLINFGIRQFVSSRNDHIECMFLFLAQIYA